MTKKEEPITPETGRRIMHVPVISTAHINASTSETLDAAVRASVLEDVVAMPGGWLVYGYPSALRKTLRRHQIRCDCERGPASAAIRGFASTPTAT